MVFKAAGEAQQVFKKKEKMCLINGKMALLHGANMEENTVSHQAAERRRRRLDTCRQTIMTVRVAELPLLVQEVGLRRRLDVEEGSGMLSSLLSAPESMWLFTSICGQQRNTSLTNSRSSPAGGGEQIFTVHLASPAGMRNNQTSRELRSKLPARPQQLLSNGKQLLAAPISAPPSPGVCDL